MSKSNSFKWRHYPPNLILRCVRWYYSYPLTYRQLAEMVNERFRAQVKEQKQSYNTTRKRCS